MIHPVRNQLVRWLLFQKPLLPDNTIIPIIQDVEDPAKVINLKQTVAILFLELGQRSTGVLIRIFDANALILRVILIQKLGDCYRGSKV